MSTLILTKDAPAQAASGVQLVGQPVPGTIAAQAIELDATRSAIKALEEREAVIKAGLREYLEVTGQDSVVDGNVTVSRSAHERDNIDRAKMEALYPKVLAAVTTKTPVVQIRVKIRG